MPYESPVLEINTFDLTTKGASTGDEGCKTLLPDQGL